MQAIAIDQFGQSAELHDIPVPAPGPGEIQVRMHAAGINPLDWKVAGGMLRAIGAEAKFPLTLGFDGAGTVERFGDGVTRFAVGDEVFGLVWPIVFEHGTFAEYFIASEHAALAAKPSGLSFAQAAALPMPASAALTALDTLAVSPGDTLLVVGATGGVGSYAVQLAKARDIGVIAPPPPPNRPICVASAPTSSSTTAPTMSPRRSNAHIPTGSMVFLTS
jgi:NADPH2:quinone reductase